MNKTQYTNAQFATKHSLTALDARAVLGFLASMTAIQIVGGVAKEPGQKGRKERIFEVPDNISLDMTLTRNPDLLKIPEVAKAPKAPKIPKPKVEKVAKVKAPKPAKVAKTPKAKKAKTPEVAATTEVAETPAETPVIAEVTETAPETAVETEVTA